MTQKKWRKKILALTAATMLVASNAGMVLATGISGPVEGETVAEAETETGVFLPEESTTEAETETERETETEKETETETETERETETEKRTEAQKEQVTTVPEKETTQAPEKETTVVQENGTATIVPEVKETTTAETRKTIEPSELVGMSYEDIADVFDGELDIRKRYVESEEYDADIIMDSYVDEDGNLVIIISKGAEMKKGRGLEASTSDSDSFIEIDGDTSEWDDIPVSYEYNWNNSSNCWEHGVWVNGVCYKTEPGTYSTDVRHGMQLYADDGYVYLHIVFAREFSAGQIANGNDYQFWVDNKMAAYQVETPDGRSLSWYSAEPGIYEVDVRHRDSSWSYVLTDGAEACYTVKEGNVNNELELKIPLEQFTVQNGSIDLDNYSKIEFYSPNLMYNRIGCAGSPTGSIPFAAAAFTLVPTSFIWLKKKKK